MAHRKLWVCEKWNDYEPGEVFAVAPDERTAVHWLERTRDAELRSVNRARREFAERRMRKDDAVIVASDDRWSFTIGSSTWLVRQHPFLPVLATLGEPIRNGNATAPEVDSGAILETQG